MLESCTAFEYWKIGLVVERCSNIAVAMVFEYGSLLQYLNTSIGKLQQYLNIGEKLWYINIGKLLWYLKIAMFFNIRKLLWYLSIGNLLCFEILESY